MIDNKVYDLSVAMVTSWLVTSPRPSPAPLPIQLKKKKS